LAEASRKLFSELFDSVPRPVRSMLDSALQLSQLRDLHAKARLCSQAPLSRAVLGLLDIEMVVSPESVERLHRSGPLIVVANHPFGILDGLMADALLWDVRPDFKILTNTLVADAEEIGSRCLPVDVLGAVASRVNLRAVREAKQWLCDGHALVVFPAGEVSHWRTDQRCISDPRWSDFAARLALHAQAAVAPIYFVGSNSLAFQIAGFVHPRMRTARLPRELLNKRGSRVEVRIGVPVSSAELAELGSAENATAYLRARTYMLAHRRLAIHPSLTSGQAVTGTSRRAAPVTGELPGLSSEIVELEKRGCCILENSSYAVFAERGEAMRAVLHQIGRLRELTFRAVAEGTGKALDLDRFDPYYTQLVLWNKQTDSIAGGYRLVWTEDVLPSRGIDGLYTSTLFRFAPGFFNALGRAVEVGRSFICPEFQKEYAPLMLLWQAIGRLIASRPQAPVLFGPVSISQKYSEAAAALIVEHLRRRRLRPDLARLLAPRHPFRSRLIKSEDIRFLAASLSDIEDLTTPLAEMDQEAAIPVLLRHYVRLGGRIAAFNVDPNFSNVIDGLLVADLRETAPKLLAKYMGVSGAKAFLRHAAEPPFMPAAG
jgi:putative hemolysin